MLPRRKKPAHSSHHWPLSNFVDGLCRFLPCSAELAGNGAACSVPLTTLIYLNLLAGRALDRGSVRTFRARRLRKPCQQTRRVPSATLFTNCVILNRARESHRRPSRLSAMWFYDFARATSTDFDRNRISDGASNRCGLSFRPEASGFAPNSAVVHTASATLKAPQMIHWRQSIGPMWGPAPSRVQTVA